MKRSSRNLRGFLWLSLIVIYAVGSLAIDKSRAQSNDLASRIARIENNLMPLAIIKGQERRGFSITERMDYYNVPGVSVAVINKGRVEWARGYGVADGLTGRPVDEFTLFQAASISKPVTAVAAMRMVESGNLELDSDANHFLSSWKIPVNEFTNSRKVTLRHLLSHTAGLPEEACPGYAPWEQYPSLLQLLDGAAPAKTAPVRVEVLPGSEWKYSNGGYCIIQQILTDRLKRPFPDIMDELVLVPAGMTSSTFRQRLPEELLKRATTGHKSNGEPLKGKWRMYPEMASAGLWTTPSDLSRFTIAVMSSYADGRGGLLGQSVTQETLKAQMRSYGLGFKVDGEGGDFSFSHGGASPGYRCYLLAYPSETRAQQS